MRLHPNVRAALRVERRTRHLIVAMYLAAIVAANLLVAEFGAAAIYWNAFLFIGLDLTTRDRLHDAWRGKGLVWKMGLLIGAGGALSWLMNNDAGSIALASTVAFATAAGVDAGIYHLLRKRPFLVRANGSNLPGAAVDSVVFPTLAFGSFDPIVTLLQFAAKVGGGFFWSLILKPHEHDWYYAVDGERTCRTCHLSQQMV